MPDVKVKSKYQEDENFVPDPTDARAFVDTTGTGGSAAADIRNASHAFDLHDAQALETASRALDDDDEDVSEDLVILPGDTDGKEARKDAKARVLRKAKKAKTVEVGAPTEAQEAAAEDTSKKTRKSSGPKKSTAKKTTKKKSTARKSS